MVKEHINSIVARINTTGKICAITAKSIFDTAERLRKGESITPQSLLKSDAFFDIRVKVNRLVIDSDDFHPTTMEMDCALFQHANYVLGLASYAL
ncbi:MAG: hypothetical protein J5595_03430 [Bacteroidales bacterium]|nr:hypothetical protein [Bacteroidales bacterium]